MIKNIFSVPVASYDLSEYTLYLRDQFEKVDKGGEELITSFPAFYNSTYDSSRIIKQMGGVNETSVKLYSKIKDCAFDFASNISIPFGNSYGYDFHIREFWYNEMTSGQSHRKHIHPARCFSAVIYIDMPNGCPGITFDSPTTRFDRLFLTAAEMKEEYSTEYTLNPIEGEMLMWESWIPHQVKSTQFNGIRRCVGIDIEICPRLNFDT